MKALDLYLSSTIEYESYIPSFSKIIGKTFRAVEKEFEIKIEHYHNSPTNIETRRSPHLDIAINCGMSLKILGLQENINRLCIAYELP